MLVLSSIPLSHPFLGPEPCLGSLYEPRLQPDYDPSMFDLKKALLAQQEVYDTDGKLISPWDVRSALRPGTLVAVEATLVVYSFCSETPATVCVSPAFL